MANTPYYTKAETDAIEASLRTQYNYGAVEYRGFLLKTDIPTLDGWYWATEIGTYTNAGNLVTVANKINMIEKSETTYKLYAIDVPVTEIVDGFLSTSTDEAGSANNDRLLNNKIEDISKSLKLLEQPDGFYLIDINGYIIAKITPDGIQSVAFLNKEGEDLAGVSNAIKLLQLPDGFGFVDSLGFMVGKITADGFQGVDFLDKNGNSLATPIPTILTTLINGKEFYSLGDSLSAANLWQPKLAELTNSTFDATVNTNTPLSVGGTRTGGVNVTCGQWRAKLLFDLNVNPEVIFVENINDTTRVGSYLGTINDEPFMLQNIITYPTTFASLTALNTWLADGSFATYLGTFANLDKKIGSGIRFPYTDGTTKYNEFIFDSKDIINHWADTDFWKHDGSQNTLYKNYKGILEYLKTKFPTALIYWFAPTRIGIQTVSGQPYYNASFWNADGSFNMTNYKADVESVNYETLVTAQKAVCQYYGIPFLDVNKECGINPFNFLTYYPVADIHPLPIGYQKWGETIAKLI